MKPMPSLSISRQPKVIPNPYDDHVLDIPMPGQETQSAELEQLSNGFPNRVDDFIGESIDH
jgi:hypothetical protein